MKADLVSGGKPVRIFDGTQIGAHWSANGTIVFGTNPGSGVGGSIFKVAAAGGDPVFEGHPGRGYPSAAVLAARTPSHSSQRL